jgi:hypothetical protein
MSNYGIIRHYVAAIVNLCAADMARELEGSSKRIEEEEENRKKSNPQQAVEAHRVVRY